MVSPKRLFRFQLSLSIICSGLVICGISVCYRIGVFKSADNFLYDLRVKWRGPIETSGNVVLVLMDEKSAIELNRHRDNWSRRQLALALNNLCLAGAEVIGLDMVMSAPDRDSQVDLELAAAIEKCNNVVLARVSSAHRSGGVTPLLLFQDGMIGDGFVDLPLDEDEVLRKIRYLNAKPLSDGSLQLLPAFSLELARAFLNIDFELDFSSPDYIRLGKPGQKQLLLPYPELLINYHGIYAAFPLLSYADIVHNRFPEEAVKGKIVVIGSSLATQKDFFSTPYSRFLHPSNQYLQKFGTVVMDVLGAKEPGVACHAHATETILSQRFITRTSQTSIMALIILTGLMGVLFYVPRIGMLWEASILVAGIGIMVYVAYLAFLKNLLWVDNAPLVAVFSIQFVTGVVIQKAFDKRKTALVKSLFGKYVSPGVVNELLKGDISASLKGHRQDLTMLFSDLRGFTSISEDLGPETTSNLLNVYFDTMIPIVFKHQGTLDKLMGDAIMAFFGAPVEVPDHPIKAAETALQMIEEIDSLKQKSIKGIDKLEAGIGLNSGIVTVGNLGSNAFMDFTIIGDAVNLASRLEGLNKVYGTNIILSQFTASRLDGRFLLRELDKVRVKGKEEAVIIYELLGFRDQKDEAGIELIRIFKEGLSVYRAQQWDRAEGAFRHILKLKPSDGPSQLYLKRIHQFRLTRSERDWDGVTVFDHK